MAFEALGGAVEALPKRHDEQDKARIAQEAGGDEGAKLRQDEGNAAGEIGHEGAEMRRDRSCGNGRRGNHAKEFLLMPHDGRKEKYPAG